MARIQEITHKIEELRSLMHSLMNEANSLTDTELVSLSQELDKLLNEYSRLIDHN